jgi:hypothetical protein
MGSIGYSFGVLKGYIPGDPDEAQKYLDSLRPEELVERNRQESRVKNKLRKRAMVVGSMPRMYKK